MHVVGRMPIRTMSNSHPAYVIRENDDEKRLLRNAFAHVDIYEFNQGKYTRQIKSQTPSTQRTKFVKWSDALYNVEM